MCRTMMMVVVLLALAYWQNCADAAETVQSFSFDEYLGDDWEGELVFMALDAPLPDDADKSHSLLDPDGKPVAFQLVNEGDAQKLAFLVNLPANKEVTYRLVNAAAPATLAHPFRVKTGDADIEVDNGLVGIRVPAATGEFRQGPLSAMRLPSGAWTGASRLTGTKEITSYVAKANASGPVFVDVTASYVFADETTWRITFRIVAGDPVVILDESFNLGEGAIWEFAISSDAFKPDAFSFRNTALKEPGRKQDGSTVIHAPEGKRAQVLYLEPWLQWANANNVQFMGTFAARKGIRYIYSEEDGGPVEEVPATMAKSIGGDDEGTDVALDEDDAPLTVKQHRKNKGDVFFVGAANAIRWSDPGKKQGPKSGVPIMVSAEGEVSLRAKLRGPGRRWIFGASTVAKTVTTDRVRNEPHTYFIKYCITPLESVLRLPVSWAEKRPAQKHPWLFFDAKDVARARERFPDTPRYAQSRKKVYWQFMHNPTDEAKQSLRKQVLASIDRRITPFTRGTGLGSLPSPSPTKGTVHYCEGLGYLLLEADLAFSSDIFTDEEKALVRKRLAFIGARIGSANYYDLGRDHRANPNMTTMRHMIAGLFGCFLPNHPMAKKWYALGEEEIEREVKSFAGPNGGWIESPHYQTLSHIMVLFQRAAYKAGLCKEPYNKRLLKSIRYLARISTPRDRAFYGLRHFPAVGDTPRYELSMLSSVVAKVIAEHDKEAANELQWTWYEHGKPLAMGIGGDCMANYISEYLVADFEPTGAPAWKSELFPLGAAILRTSFPSDRETQLHLLGGMKWSHFSRDNGSFTLYGKGEPLVLDWGYKGIMPTWWHSKIDLAGLGYFKHFAALDPIDTVRFSYQRKDTWNRSVMMVKDKDPLGPNYYLLHDRVKGKGRKDDWLLWLYTRKVPEAKGNVVTVTGRGDVDMDVYFAPPWAEKLLRIPADEADFINDPNKLPETGQGGLEEGDEEELSLEDEPEELSPFIDTKPHSYSNASGRVRKGDAPIFYRYGNSADPIFQRALQLQVERGKPLFVVLYPRLRKDKAPTFTPLGNEGVKVVSGERTDYAFLSDRPLSYKDDEVVFEGVSGAVIVTKESVTLCIGEKGSIAYGGHELKSDTPTSKSFPLK